MVGHCIDKLGRVRGDHELTSLARFDHEIAYGWQDVRVQAEFRLLDHDHRRRCQIEQNRQKTKVTKAAVRQSTGREHSIIFGEVELELTALGYDLDIVEAWGQFPS